MKQLYISDFKRFVYVAFAFSCEPTDAHKDKHRDRRTEKLNDDVRIYIFKNSLKNGFPMNMSI